MSARRVPAGEAGREVVEYVDSWVSEDLTRCYQLMRADEAAFVHTWCEAWSDLVEFEVVPVLTSDEASQAVEEDLRG